MRSSRDRVKRFLWDLSGAFGDIGVLFPIAIALVVRNGFNPTALFLMAGIFYVASARYFRITMPVQPLKAMSAIAIGTGLGCEVINAAGLAMGIILLMLSFSGLSVRLGALFPLSVIRGIQLGLGLMLMKGSWVLMRDDAPTTLTAAAVLAACLLFFKKVPPLLPLLLLGVVVAMRNAPSAPLGPVPLSPAIPDPASLVSALTLLVLPQIGLTFGNAIVATEATGRALYGEKAERVTLRTIPLSMGIANVLSALAGGAPMCHGSGGLTAHAKFGATTEKSGYVIGVTLIAAALFLGRSALTLISAFPAGILGVLLCCVGVQHALFIRDIVKDRTSLCIALGVALLGVITGNLTIGFAAGIAAYYASAGSARVVKYVQTNL